MLFYLLTGLIVILLVLIVIMSVALGYSYIQSKQKEYSDKNKLEL
ncbi:hypothetical protein [Vagococcus fessus]|nr:hypothetical protein [Vagococcus fessus]